MRPHFPSGAGLERGSGSGDRGGVRNISKVNLSDPLQERERDLCVPPGREGGVDDMAVNRRVRPMATFSAGLIFAWCPNIHPHRQHTISIR